MPIKLLFLLLGLVQAFSCLDARTAFSQHPEEKKTTEEIFFQEIPSVFGASKFEQKQTEAPSSITILTQNEIKKFGYRTLGDVLRSVRGFFVNYDRNYSYIGVRGFGRPGDYNT
ncbi:MAG: TonB-dependent receptor plug domain-containing protein, partial [Syntrophobacteraceae bacterium]